MPVVNPGIRRQVAGAITRLFNSAAFALPLTHTAVPTRGSITPSFTRATTETGQRWDEAGYLDFTALAGEVVWKGARRVRNLLPSTEGAFNAGAGWTILNGTVTSGVTDPNDGTTAYTLKQTGVASCELYPTTPFSGIVLSSLWIRRRVGSGTILLYSGDSSENITSQVTSEWQRIQGTLPGTSAVVGFDIRLFTQDDEIDIWHPQAEDVTGQTTQTASEYVSVGVPADWAGDELVTNGAFDTDTTGWTGVTAALSVASGALRVTATGDYGFAYQAITTVVGARYVLAVDIIVGTGALFLVRVGTTIGGFDNYDSGFVATATQKLIVNFTATATTTYVNLLGHVTGTYTDFDNISVKPAYYHGSMVDGVKCYDTDRSGNLISTSGSYPLVGYVPWGARTNLLLQSAVVATQSITVAAVAHTLSFKGTGTITLSGVSVAGPLVGTGANDRVTLTFTPTAGSLTLTVSGSCTVGQLEAGSFATPYIPTTTVAVARNASVLTYTGADVANTKTLAMRCTPVKVSSGAYQVALQLDDGTGNERHLFAFDIATPVMYAQSIDGGVVQSTINSGTKTAGVEVKASYSFAANDMKADFDGTAGTPDTSGTMPSGITTMRIGGGVAGAAPFNGPVNHIYGWTRNLSQSELGAVDA